MASVRCSRSARWRLPASRAEPVVYDWFEYTGRDAVFEAAAAAGTLSQSILSGFHRIEHHARRRALLPGHSTFAYFPGIPVFESRDLVHWRQIGSVIDRPSQLDFSKLGVSRGVFAPSIEYRDGLFYVFNTHVDGGGNYVVTAKNPAAARGPIRRGCRSWRAASIRRCSSTTTDVRTC